MKPLRNAHNKMTKNKNSFQIYNSNNTAFNKLIYSFSSCTKAKMNIKMTEIKEFSEAEIKWSNKN